MNFNIYLANFLKKSLNLWSSVGKKFHCSHKYNNHKDIGTLDFIHETCCEIVGIFFRILIRAELGHPIITAHGFVILFFSNINYNLISNNK